ncbi:anthrone oxygenase family protein [Modestobacter sp. SYSU DS0657]
MELLPGLAALGAGLVAGAFAVFSLMVMPALAALSANAGVAAMQSVNRTALRPAFLTLLLGTAALCLATGVRELVGDGRPALLAGAAAYLVGVVGVTVAGNVPLNEVLARLDAGSSAAGERWPGWVRRWTGWNTVRALAGTAAAALLAVAAAG